MWRMQGGHRGCSKPLIHGIGTSLREVSVPLVITQGAHLQSFHCFFLLKSGTSSTGGGLKALPSFLEIVSFDLTAGAGESPH